MTILSRPQEGDLLTFENHYGYTSDAVNPVVTSAEFVLKVIIIRVNARFFNLFEKKTSQALDLVKINEDGVAAAAQYASLPSPLSLTFFTH
jgi:hypothetical protein